MAFVIGQQRLRWVMAEPRPKSYCTDRPVHDESRHPHHNRNFNQLRFMEIRINAVNSKLRMHMALKMSFSVCTQAAIVPSVRFQAQVFRIFLALPMTCISQGLQSKRSVSFSSPLMSSIGSGRMPLTCFGQRLKL